MLIRKIKERTSLYPLYLYKSLLKDEKDIIQKIHQIKIEKPLTNYIKIDRRYLQRLIESWPKEKGLGFLRDWYGGLDKVDAYVLVSIQSIIDVFAKEQKKTNDKSTIDDFLQDLHTWKRDGIDWMLINGQHRDDVFSKLWNNKLELPNDFNYGIPVHNEIVSGKKWNQLSLETRVALLERELLLTFVDKISSLSDLKTIVKRHNEGNSWNAHQERMRETSYIARKFAELDEDASLKKLFIHLGTKTDLSYSPKLNGISLLALQMFLIWNNPGERPSIQGKTSPVLDSIVLTESLDWTMKRVKKFISLFHTFADELNNHYIKKAKDKNNKEVLPIAGLKFQISLLRNYIMFRLLINGNIETYSKDEYTVNDIKSLVQYYLHSEAHRRNDRQQYNTMGKKKYDKLIEKSKKGKLGGDKLKKEISSLKKYIPDMSYNRSLASASSPAYLANVLVEIQNDFISKLDGKLKGVVIKKGEKVDPFMKRIIREQAVLNSDGSIEEMSDKSNPIKYDIGHLEIPRAKGGEPTLKNLGLQDRSENRRQQDKH